MEELLIKSRRSLSLAQMPAAGLRWRKYCPEISHILVEPVVTEEGSYSDSLGINWDGVHMGAQHLPNRVSSHLLGRYGPKRVFSL